MTNSPHLEYIDQILAQQLNPAPLSMRSHELIQAIFQQHSAKSIAAQLNLSLPRVYQWAQPPEPEGNGMVNPLDRVAGLLDATGDDRIAAWVCSHAGGFFIKNAVPKGISREHLPAASHKLIQQFASMLELVSNAAVDGQITKDEAIKLRQKWQHAQAVTEAFLQECDKGSFRANHAKRLD